MSRLRASSFALAALLGTSLAMPPAALSEDKNLPAAQPEKKKETPEELRALTDAEKQKRLDDIEKLYEDNRRNQDLIPVRTRRNGVNMIGDLRYPPSAKFLWKAFEDDRDMTTRVAAFVAIGKCGDSDAIQRAVKYAIREAKGTPVFAATLPRMFQHVEAKEARDWIVTRVEHKDDSVVASVVEAIGMARQPGAYVELDKVLVKSRDPAVRFECLRAIGRCAGKSATARLTSFLADPDWRLRMAAAEALGYAGDPASIADLKKLVVRTETPIVVETALEAIGALGTKDAVEPLIEGLKIARLRARQKARKSLRALAKSLFQQEKDYHVDAASWTTWWNKAKIGTLDDATFSGHETTSYFSFPIHSDRVLFILDVSGSMQWPNAPEDSDLKPSEWKNRRIDFAHKEMFKALRELAKQNRGRIRKAAKGETVDVSIGEDGKEPPTMFNVATFAGVVTPWQKTSVVATDENAEAAIAWIEKQFPRGGTATYDALAYGLAQEEIDTIYFLSDGVPSLGRFEERETILGEVRKLNRFKRVTIHTIALIIGLSPIESARKYEDPEDMADIMSRIAAENQGQFANESK